jgi:hypothetical protein
MKKLFIIMAFLLIYGVAFADVTVYIPQATDVEDSDGRVTVNIPFDTEYQIALENHDHARRALVKIRIDGRNVTRDGLILRAGESVWLDRFLDSGTLGKGKRFKFVPQDPGAIQFKDDGLMFIQVQYEKARWPIIRYEKPYTSSIYWEEDAVPMPCWPEVKSLIDGWSVMPSVTIGTNSLYSADYSVKMSITSDTSPGITIEGGESRQRFQEEKFGDPEGDEQSIIISMVGYWKEKAIAVE